MLNFNLGTSINNQPNYDVGMTVDPGLMNQAQQVHGGLAGSSSWGWGSNGGTANATTQQVDPNQLMSHQMNSLMDQDGAYLQRGRREGEAAASRRGLMNSSIMAGSAMGALADRAAPIAQFDAGRYGSVADQNMAAQNQASLTNAQIAGQLQGQGMSQRHGLDQQYQQHQFGALDDYRRHMLGIEQREDDQSFRGGQADIDRFLQDRQFWDHSAPLAWQQQQHQERGLNAQIYQGQFAPYFQALSGIYSNPNLDAQQMNAAAGNLGQMFPGMAQAAWNSLPPGLINQQAQGAAQNMPPMGPIQIGGGP